MQAIHGQQQCQLDLAALHKRGVDILEKVWAAQEVPEPTCADHAQGKHGSLLLFFARGLPSAFGLLLDVNNCFVVF